MSDDDDDIDVNWNRFEWKRYYRLRYVVDEVAKAIACIGGGVFGYFTHTWAKDAGWDNWAVITVTIVAFMTGFALISHQLDLERD